MGMILRIASSRIVGQGDIVGRSGYFSLNLSANSVMRGRLDARRTLKSLVADLRGCKNQNDAFIKQIKDVFRSKVRVAPDICFVPVELIARQQHPEMSRKPIKFFDLRNN